LGDAEEFLGVEIRKGFVFVKGKCKGFVGAKMNGGRIICRRTKPVPPVKEKALEKGGFSAAQRVRDLWCDYDEL
jgi:GXGXG motif.